jgi:hypothetical protein
MTQVRFSVNHTPRFDSTEKICCLNKFAELIKAYDNIVVSLRGHTELKLLDEITCSCGAIVSVRLVQGNDTYDTLPCDEDDD